MCRIFKSIWVLMETCEIKNKCFCTNSVAVSRVPVYNSCHPWNKISILLEMRQRNLYLNCLCLFSILKCIVFSTVGESNPIQWVLYLKMTQVDERSNWVTIKPILLNKMCSALTKQLSIFKRNSTSETSQCWEKLRKRT